MCLAFHGSNAPVRCGVQAASWSQPRLQEVSAQGPASAGVCSPCLGSCPAVLLQIQKPNVLCWWPATRPASPLLPQAQRVRHREASAVAEGHPFNLISITVHLFFCEQLLCTRDDAIRYTRRFPEEMCL